MMRRVVIVGFAMIFAIVVGNTARRRVFFNRDNAIKKVPPNGSAPPSVVGHVPPMRGTRG